MLPTVFAKTQPSILLLSPYLFRIYIVPFLVVFLLPPPLFFSFASSSTLRFFKVVVDCGVCHHMPHFLAPSPAKHRSFTLHAALTQYPPVMVAFVFCCCVFASKTAASIVLADVILFKIPICMWFWHLLLLHLLHFVYLFFFFSFTYSHLF